MLGWTFDTYKIWADYDSNRPLPLLAVTWSAYETIPKKGHRPSYLLDFIRHRTHIKVKWATLTWLRIEYTLQFEKIIKVYTKEELFESR